MFSWKISNMVISGSAINSTAPLALENVLSHKQLSGWMAGLKFCLLWVLEPVLLFMKMVYSGNKTFNGVWGIFIDLLLRGCYDFVDLFWPDVLNRSIFLKHFNRIWFVSSVTALSWWPLAIFVFWGYNIFVFTKRKFEFIMLLMYD